MAEMPAEIAFAQQFGGALADDETHFDRGELWDAYNAGRADEREACAQLVAGLAVNGNVSIINRELLRAARLIRDRNQEAADGH